MLTKTDRVKAAIRECEQWYLDQKRNVHTLNERIEAMWYEVKFHVARMELAERDGSAASAAYHLDCITQFVTRIYAEAGPERERQGQ